uniref:Uncharacterized protein n=1 Tax=Cannabis sativa TaxID=3483 RepID=A0A803QP23_CANSA
MKKKREIVKKWSVMKRRMEKIMKLGSKRRAKDVRMALVVDVAAAVCCNGLVEELDLYPNTTPLSANYTTIQRQQLEKEQVFEFLIGLNNNLDEVRGRLVGHSPFLDTEEAFFQVRREKERRCVMLTTPDVSPIESFSLVSKSRPLPSDKSNPDSRPNREGDHC